MLFAFPINIYIGLTAPAAQCIEARDGDCHILRYEKRHILTIVNESQRSSFHILQCIPRTISLRALIQRIRLLLDHALFLLFRSWWNLRNPELWILPLHVHQKHRTHQHYSRA